MELQIKNRLTYLGIGIFYIISMVLLVSMTIDTGLADNATVDTSQLTSSITTASLKAGNAIAGIEPGQYPQSAITTFREAISIAQTVSNNAITQSEIDQAIYDLEAAEALFDTAMITSVNKTTLSSSITTATLKLRSAVAGTGQGQYPQTIINAFNTTIVNVQTILNDPDATQAEVNQAVITLKSAEAIFDASKITSVNKTTLASVITTAYTKLSLAIAGTEIGQYSQSAIDAFNISILNAQAILSNENTTQSQVDQATIDLTAAEAIFDTSRITSNNLTVSCSISNISASNIGPSWIRWTWTNPLNTSLGYIMVYLDNVFVTNIFNSSIDSYNATGLGEATTHTISIHTVDTSGNIDYTGINNTATTIKIPVISSVSSTEITNTSITLVWNASNETTNTQIQRNGLIIGNISEESYVDSGLTSNTIYTYNITPYNNGFNGNTIKIVVRTNSSNTIESKSGGGGGSIGGASTAEDFRKILIKDVARKFILADTYVIYNFNKTADVVPSIGFKALKNSGEITTTVEILNNRSKLVDSDPQGNVYTYVNVWVGKSGFATDDNIEDGWVKFHVNESWMQKMCLSPTDVKLQRYDGYGWEELPTIPINSSINNTYTAQTDGFSSFAITGEQTATSKPDDVYAQTMVLKTKSTRNDKNTTNSSNTTDTQPEKSNLPIYAVGTCMVMGLFAGGFVFLKKH
ncbi:outer membrane protein (plasmid) [Methanomethylovorans hollandica DSM 15978]|jgi:PGF-pre-PGF domain-containing protein|uniref:Outer membrane protein n=1 Tax=Methanomethylovorans hollandica (strain DSM 15978 / NBRC 107637 / DMS1) TaxID=867904 RepID=L0L1I0_METHD|nr:PGF-pre-PGF domain-containing protein [Methanomethylovorans hollandica]AGB50775.1 outer membrane protein [Methanomethylovorans hollandica DSM 15978]